MSHKEHILYEGVEPDCPDTIRDGNGDVALGLCRVCGAGEIELLGPCVSWKSRAIAAEANRDDLVEAVERLLTHSAFDVDPMDVDEEDKAKERRARDLLAKIKGDAKPLPQPPEVA